MVLFRSLMCSCAVLGILSGCKTRDFVEPNAGAEVEATVDVTSSNDVLKQCPQLSSLRLEVGAESKNNENYVRRAKGANPCG